MKCRNCEHELYEDDYGLWFHFTRHYRPHGFPYKTTQCYAFLNDGEVCSCSLPQPDFHSSEQTVRNNKKEITQLFYPEDKNLEHFYKIVNKLRDERLIRSSEQVIKEGESLSWEERYWEEFGAHYHTWDALQEMTSIVHSLSGKAKPEVEKND